MNRRRKGCQQSKALLLSGTASRMRGDSKEVTMVHSGSLAQACAKGGL